MKQNNIKDTTMYITRNYSELIDKNIIERELNNNDTPLLFKEDLNNFELKVIEFNIKKLHYHILNVTLLPQINNLTFSTSNHQT